LTAYSSIEGKLALPTLEALPTHGTYTLIVHLKSPGHIAAPSHSWSLFKGGYYAYTGSALGEGSVSLRQRVKRHLRRKKTKHWHIDYLLHYTEIINIFYILIVSCLHVY
jgi:Uri superfamily endonuclease